MATHSDFNGIKTIFEKLASATGRVARFSYTNKAFNDSKTDLSQIDGVPDYDYTQEQNIPLATHTDTDPVVLDKGVRAQGASIARMFQNHFTGRVSFNLNMVVDMFVSFLTFLIAFFTTNANKYDATARYYPGDLAYTVWTAGAKRIYLWYERTSTDPGGCVGVPLTDTTRWRWVREQTSLGRDLKEQPVQNFRGFIETGLYYFITDNPVVMADAPPIPSGDSGSFLLNVKGDLFDKDIVIQEVHYRDSGVEYTRTLQFKYSANVGAEVWQVIQPWYRTKDPKGLEIIGVNGVWAFRVEADGNLYLYYNDDEPPPLYIERTAGHPQQGHLIWPLPWPWHLAGWHRFTTLAITLTPYGGQIGLAVDLEMNLVDGWMRVYFSSISPGSSTALDVWIELPKFITKYLIRHPTNTPSIQVMYPPKSVFTGLPIQNMSAIADLLVNASSLNPELPQTIRFTIQSTDQSQPPNMGLWTNSDPFSLMAIYPFATQDK